MSRQRGARGEVARAEVDPEQGLSDAQVRERSDAGWDNRPVTAQSKSVAQIIASNVFTYFNLVFAVLGLLVASTGSYRDLTFLPVVVANALIGIVQELRAKRVLDRLTVMTAPTTTVVRDGESLEVPSSELVRDDIVRLLAGDQVPADATVLTGAASANESLLTGESAEVPKAPGDTLMSGASSSLVPAPHGSTRWGRTPTSPSSPSRQRPPRRASSRRSCATSIAS